MGMSARAEVHFIIDQALANMRALEEQAVSTGKTVGTAFTGTQGELNSLYQSLNTVGRNFTIAGGAITGFFGLATHASMNFEAQISAVGAVSNATAEELDKLREVALQVGADTTFSATEVAAAMEILAKVGMDLEDIYGGVAEGAVRLSEATGADITTSAEIAATAMTVFNLSAEDAVDVMNTLAQSANASTLDLSDWITAIQYAAPIAATLGYTIDDVAQSLVILGNSGITGSVAATSLRNMLNQLADSGSKVNEAMMQVGVSIYDSNGNMKNMAQITRDLVPYWNTLDEKMRVNMANEWFGPRGGPAFLNMMNAQAEAVNRGGDAFEEAGIKMDETGDIYSMSQTRMDNLAGAVERLRGSFDTLMIKIGTALTPAIRFLVEALDWVVDKMADLPDWMITVIAVFGSLAGILLTVSGGFLLMLPQILAMQKAMADLGGMGGVLKLLISPLKGIGSAITFMLSPMGLLIIGLVALAGALIYAYYHSESFRKVVNKIASMTWDFLSSPVVKLLAMSTAFGLVVSNAGRLIPVITMLGRSIMGIPAIITTVTTAVRGLMVAMSGLLLNPAFLIAAAAFAALFIAYKTNFLGFGDAVDSALGKVKEFYDFVFGAPDNKSIGVTLDTDLTGDEDAWDNWTKMPDGTWKHATLGITTQGVNATVSWITNPDSPDGKDWTLNVDVDGDGLPDATKIIDSVNQGGGKYVMIVEINGQKYEAWYDEKTHQTLLLPVEVEIANEGEVQKSIDDMNGFEQTVRGVNAILFAANMRWDEFLSRTSGLRSALANAAQWLWSFLDPLESISGVMPSIANQFRAITTVLMGDWGKVNWRNILDYMGLHSVVVLVEMAQNVLNKFSWPDWPSLSWSDILDLPGMGAAVGLLKDLKSAWDAWTGRGGSDWEPTDDGGIKEGDTGTTAYPAPEAQPTVPFLSGLDLKGIDIGVLDNIVSRAGSGKIALDGLRSSGERASAMFAGTFGPAISQTDGMVIGFGNSAKTADTVLKGSGAGMQATFTALANSAQSESSRTQLSFTNNIGTMATAVAGKMMGIKTNMAIQMALMASSATTQGNAISNNMGSGIAANIGRITGAMASINVAIALAGSAGAAAAYNAGVNISSSFASGMLAYLGLIRSAASAMVAAANAAVVAKAMIASPSRLARYWADMIGIGFVDTLESYQRPAAIAANNLIHEPMIDMDMFGKMAADNYGMYQMAEMNGPFSPYAGYANGASQSTVTYIDQSQYVALNEDQFAGLLEARDRANIAYDHLNDPDALAQYGD
jgi:TP901 family phage tail tape measure protein